jgi:hypothetical protein
MRYDPIRTIKRRAGANTSLCAAQPCSNPRHGVSELCAGHMRNRKVHGHPNGRHLPACTYAREMREAQAFLRDARRADPQTQQVLAKIAEWLKDARWGHHTVPAQRELLRLSRHGVNAEQMLAEWIAIYTYAQRNPRELPHDARLNFTLANRTLALAPREVANTVRDGHGGQRHVYAIAPKPEREALGTAIRFIFVMYLAGVAAALDDPQHPRRPIPLTERKLTPA